MLAVRCQTAAAQRNSSQSPKIALFSFEKWPQCVHYSLYFGTQKKEQNWTFCLTLNLCALSIITHQAGPRSLWGCFVGARSQACWQERCTEIYYNQIRLWSELKEDVKMESRLNVAWVILSRVIWTFRAQSVGPDYPPRCFSARSPLWSSMGRAWAPAALWLRVRLPLWLLKLKLYVCSALEYQ